MKNDDPLHRRLRHAQDLDEANWDAHLGDLEIAALLDDCLEGDERVRVEAHLADCRACRELAAEAALALEVGNGGELNGLPAAARPRRWGRWAAAAALVAAIALAWLLRGADPGGPAGTDPLLAWGLDAQALAEIEPALAEKARRALDGEWPTSGAFDAFLPALGEAVLRAATAPRGPRPIAPRWSAVRVPRPTFQWAPTEPPAEAYEVLVVDAEERLVGSWDATAPEEPTGPGRFQLPATAEALLTGTVYFWKVNARLDGDWLASAYVPFRVLGDPEATALDELLDALADQPLLRALALAEYDLRDEALAALDEIEDPGVQELRRSLAAGARLPAHAPTAGPDAPASEEQR